MTPFYSIIIPCGDFDPFLFKVIKRIKESQLDESYEIIVVDNSRAQDFVKRMNGHEHLVKIINEPKRSASSARNTGAKVALGKWLVFCDTDVLMNRNWPATLKKAILQNPHISAFSATLRPAALENTFLHDYRVHFNQLVTKGTGNYLSNIGDVPTLNTALCGIRKDVYIQMQGLSETLIHLEDTEFTVRLLRYGHQLGAILEDTGEVYYLSDSIWSYLMRRYQKGKWLPYLQSMLNYQEWLTFHSLRKFQGHGLEKIYLFILECVHFFGFAVGRVRLAQSPLIPRKYFSQHRNALFFHFEHKDKTYVLAPYVGIVWFKESCDLYLFGYKKRTLTREEFSAMRTFIHSEKLTNKSEFYESWIKERIFVSSLGKLPLIAQKA